MLRFKAEERGTDKSKRTDKNKGIVSILHTVTVNHAATSDCSHLYIWILRDESSVPSYKMPFIIISHFQQHFNSIMDYVLYNPFPNISNHLNFKYMILKNILVSLRMFLQLWTSIEHILVSR